MYSNKEVLGVGRQQARGIKALVAIVLMLVGSGCGMNRISGMDSPVVPQELENLAPREVLSLAEKSMETAGQERLDYYSPTFVSLAEKHLKKAQNMMIKGADDVAVILEAESCRQMVAKGLATKQTVLRQLADVFDQKDRLDQLKADVYERSDYDDQMDHIAKLIRYIEKGDQEALEKKKKEYMADMIALEIAVVKKKTLTEPLDFLARAKANDARKLAPKTWKTAEDTLNQATVFIESFPRDEKGVERVGLVSLRACQHAFFVTQEVAAIKEMDKDHFENLVLDVETMLNRITQSMNHEDVRHMSLHDQSVALSSAAENLQRNLAASSHERLSVTPSDMPAPSEEVKAEVVSSPALNVTTAPLEDIDQSAPETVQDTPAPLPIESQAAADDGKTLDVPLDAEPQTLNLDELYMSDMDRELKNKQAAAVVAKPDKADAEKPSSLKSHDMSAPDAIDVTPNESTVAMPLSDSPKSESLDPVGDEPMKVPEGSIPSDESASPDTPTS